MKRDWQDILVPVFIGTVVAAIIALFVCAVVHMVHEKQRCFDGGGHFEKRNCRMVHDTTCTTTDYGNNMIITSCVPDDYERCDSVCIGASAEARP